MADEELIHYIKEYKEIYGVSKLRKGLLEQGVSEEEIEEALETLEDEERAKNQKVVEEIGEDEKLALESEAIVDRKKGIARDLARYSRKADSLLHALLKIMKVASDERDFYAAVIRYGALVFVMMAVVIAVFQYFGKAVVYPKIASDFINMGSLQVLPDILVVDIGGMLLSLLFAVFWGAIWSFIFIRYGLKWWPFKMWHQAVKKITVFYFAIHFVFGIIIDGILVSFSGIFFLGYFIVVVGMAIASSMGAIFFLQSMEKRHEDKLKELIRKSW